MEKIIQNGLVYKKFTAGRAEVVEIAPPTVTHDAPASVAMNVDVAISFALFDFDGEARTDTGSLNLLVDGTPVAVPIVNGAGVLLCEFQVAGLIRIEDAPPYLADARMASFTIEVAA